MQPTSQAATQPTSATRPSTQPVADGKGAVGKPMVRRDGRLKVTGRATYSAEWPLKNIAYAVLLQSPVAKGKIKSIDTKAAERLPGFVGVLTHQNAPVPSELPVFGGGGKMGPDAPGAAMRRPPLGDNSVHFAGQIIAVVVGETLDQARRCAELIDVKYEVEDSDTDFHAHLDEGKTVQQNQGQPVPIRKGDPNAAFESAPVKLDATYDTPRENHNPIEPHATLVDPAPDGTVTVYDATQNIFGTRDLVARMFNINRERVRVVCKFIGGAFGCKGSAWPHVAATALAAAVYRRPVKLVLERAQMYGGVGGRAWTRQRMQLGAKEDGTLISFLHTGFTATARRDVFIEQFTRAGEHMYAAPNRLALVRVVPLDIVKPTFMRAPGETPGSFAVECAMDELAVQLKMDPIELRRRNEPAVDPSKDKPFSLRKLMECFDRGAQKFGWNARNAEPRSMRDEKTGHLVGYGCAAATYPHNTFPNQAKLTLDANGSLLVTCGTHEMGTGTTTALSQLTADLVGMPVQRVRMELGDTNFVYGAVSGGSATIAGVGCAIRNAVTALHQKLAALATARGGPLKGADPQAITFRDGRLAVEGRSVSIEALLDGALRDKLEAQGEHKPGRDEPYSTHSYGAHFCEVRVDETLGILRIARHTGVFNCGTILNAKTGHSQFVGGIVMGYGMALGEDSITDHRFGRITNDNLAEYHVPVNADIGPMEIDWINEPDFKANPTGAKGVGEIGITGVAAAVANALYHATGRRIRSLPLTPERVMGLQA